MVPDRASVGVAMLNGHTCIHPSNGYTCKLEKFSNMPESLQKMELKDKSASVQKRSTSMPTRVFKKVTGKTCYEKTGQESQFFFLHQSKLTF